MAEGSYVFKIYTTRYSKIIIEGAIFLCFSLKYNHHAQIQQFLSGGGGGGSKPYWHKKSSDKVFFSPQIILLFQGDGGQSFLVLNLSYIFQEWGGLENVK